MELGLGVGWEEDDGGGELLVVAGEELGAAVGAGLGAPIVRSVTLWTLYSRRKAAEKREVG